MRELRFRAWHEEDKVMVYDLNTPSLLHGVLQKDDYILMQYTGLKDRNGREIFEGDILCTSISQLLRSSTPIPEINGIVKFKEGAFRCDAKKIHEYNIYLISFLNLSARIIGNKFENPELVEGEL